MHATPPTRQLSTFPIAMQLAVRQGPGMGTVAASTLSTVWLHAQLGQLCDGSDFSVWDWPGPPAAPVMRKVARSLTSDTGLGQGDLGMETDTVRPTALQQALEVVPLLWQRLECALPPCAVCSVPTRAAAPMRARLRWRMCCSAWLQNISCMGTYIHFCSVCKCAPPHSKAWSSAMMWLTQHITSVQTCKTPGLAAHSRSEHGSAGQSATA